MNNYTMILRAALVAFALILLVAYWSQPPELSEHEAYYEAQR